MDHVTAGGIFVTKQESVYFRALIYKRSNVFPHIDKKFLTNGLMVHRQVSEEPWSCVCEHG